MKNLNNYVVLYRNDDIQSITEEPLSFQCYAKNVDHAEEQCRIAEPYSDIVWIWEGPEGVGARPALDEYYESSFNA